MVNSGFAKVVTEPEETVCAVPESASHGTRRTASNERRTGNGRNEAQSEGAGFEENGIATTRVFPTKGRGRRANGKNLLPPNHVKTLSSGDMRG